MSYKIVMDSCCELPEKYMKDERFEFVPLGLEIGDYHILDDENFDQADFLKRVAESPVCAKSSCPSPERFCEAYRCDAEHVYVVTLSSKLSGSHNSAVLGMNLYHEEYGEKQIHVVDSESASCGEAQIALKLMDLEEQGLSFEEVVEQIEKFRDEINIHFILDNLETLRKNGRLTGVKALVASTLSIKPLMSADKGEIIQKGQSIGMKKALSKLADMVVESVKGREKNRLIITHCNALARAEKMRDLILSQVQFKECIIMDTRGLSTLYANDGGVLVSA